MKVLKVLLLWFAACRCGAQLPECYISTITGTATVARDFKIKALKKGDYIFKTDTITVKKSTVITLVDHEDRIFEINQPGRFTYTDIQKTLNEKQAGITASFFKFIWEELFKPESQHSPVSPKSIGGAVGGASRGVCDLLEQPLNMCKINDDTVRFSWHPFAHTTLYRFTLQDSSAHDIINILTQDTSLAIFKADLLTGQTTPYYWKISSDKSLDGSCYQLANYFTLTSDSERAREMEAIISKVDKDSDDIIYNLKMSELLAKNGWLNESYKYYLAAKEKLIDLQK